MKLHALGREVVHVDVGAALSLAELHHRADVARAGDHRGADVGLGDRLDHAGVGHLGRRVDLDHLAVGERDLVAHVRRRRDQLEVVLALEPLADDVHVQQAEEAAAKAEAERLRGLRLVGERRVVERQPLERVAQVLVAVGLDRIEAGRRPSAGPRGSRAAPRRPGRCFDGQRVADAQLRDVLEPGDHVADVAGRRSRRRGASAG